MNSYSYQLQLSRFTITAATYRELSKELLSRNYGPFQYSDWIKQNTTAVRAYMTMVSLLTRIEPPGKLESTLKSIKVYYLAHPCLDGTQAIRLGGPYSQHLWGPTPAHLVPENVAAVAPRVLLEPPRFTRASQQALDTNNWRVSP